MTNFIYDFNNIKDFILFYIIKIIKIIFKWVLKYSPLQKIFIHPPLIFVFSPLLEEPVLWWLSS